LFEHRYLKTLISFSHHKATNIGNISRIDPSLLGVKDASSFTKNALYLHGVSSAPLLCFSLILVTQDRHEHGRIIGTEPKEWVLKDISGVLLAMELERFIAVLGLVYELPYVADDSARREGDLLHISMVNNAFCFTTSMVLKAGECSFNVLYWQSAQICEQNLIMQKLILLQNLLLNAQTSIRFLHPQVLPSVARQPYLQRPSVNHPLGHPKLVWALCKVFLFIF
jgi:hypothetical protein